MSCCEEAHISVIPLCVSIVSSGWWLRPQLMFVTYGQEDSSSCVR